MHDFTESVCPAGLAAVCRATTYPTGGQLMSRSSTAGSTAVQTDKHQNDHLAPLGVSRSRP